MSTELPLPTTTSGGGPSDGSGGMQRGASYFFGFLITFVVLLLIFVGCGVVSRRRYSARQRARFEWNMEPWAERTEEGVGYVPPVLLEKAFASTRQGSTLWKDLIPLAALIVTPFQISRSSDVATDVPSSPPLSAPHQTPLSPPVYGGRDIESLEIITRTLSAASRRRSESAVDSGRSGLVRLTSSVPYHRNPNVILAQHEAEQQDRDRQREDGAQNEPQEQAYVHRRHGWLHFLNPSSCLRYLFRRRTERGLSMDVEQGTRSALFDEKSQKNTFVQKDLVLQVAVLIEMPSRAPHTPEDGEQLPAYEIGVANVPWTHELREGMDARRSSSTSPSD